MLFNTFSHIPRISKETEMKLWKKNILCWDDAPKINGFMRYRGQTIIDYIEKSKEKLKTNDHTFFTKTLASADHWRAYKEFGHKTCFLDIETTGLSKYYNDVTTVGIYNGKKSKVFIKGKDLDKFQKELKKYSMIVTFNGKSFDIPFLEHKFGINPDQFHLDLRYPLSKLGYTGGLKKIEKVLGIDRGELADIDGREAVRLWKRYEKGDNDALKLLVKYNTEDIVNLKTLADFTYEKMRSLQFLSRI